MLSFVEAVFFILTVIVLTISVIKVKHSNKKENLICRTVLAFFTVTLYGSFTAGFLSLLHIPTNIVSSAILNLLAIVFIMLKIRKDKAVQKYEVKPFDIGFLISCLAVVLFIGFYRFGAELDWFCYSNGDSSRHLNGAIKMFYDQKVGGMYFARYGVTVLVDVFKMIPDYEYFRMFLVYDIYMLFMSAALFFVLIRDSLKKKSEAVVGLIFTYIFMLGYPLYNFLEGTGYWGSSVLILLYIIYMLRQYTKGECINRKYILIYLMLANAGLAVAYIAFVPAVYAGETVFICIHLCKQKKFLHKETFISAAVAYILPIVLFMVYGVFGQLGVGSTNDAGMKQSGSDRISTFLSLPGSVYTDMYMVYVPFLLFAIFNLVYIIKKKKNDAAFWLFTAIVGNTFIYFIGIMLDKIMPYYFYKNYILVWTLVVYFCYQGTHILMDEKQGTLVGIYLTGMIMLLIMCFANVDQMLIDKGEYVARSAKVDSFLGIYTENRNRMYDTYCNVSWQQQEFIRYAGMFSEENNVNIPFVGNDCTWWWTKDPYLYYYNMSGQFLSPDKEHYVYDEDNNPYEFTEGCEYISIAKSSNLYDMNREYFDSFETVYENDYAVLKKIK